MSEGHQEGIKSMVLTTMFPATGKGAPGGHHEHQESTNKQAIEGQVKLVSL